MSDDKLQQLWSAWQASHSVEDEAAFLQERLRLGELTLLQLDLASFCGHKAARQALVDTGVTPTPVAEDGWLDELASGWGEATRARYTQLSLSGLNQEWGHQLSDTGECEPDLERTLEKAARSKLAREALSPTPPDLPRE